MGNSLHSLLNKNVQCTYWAYVFSDPTGVLTIKIVKNPHILPPGHGFKKSLGSENAVFACSRLRESADWVTEVYVVDVPPTEVYDADDELQRNNRCALKAAVYERMRARKSGTSALVNGSLQSFSAPKFGEKRRVLTFIRTEASAR
jgi:hypothetical protein